jgi:hypothetical protein
MSYQFPRLGTLQFELDKKKIITGRPTYGGKSLPKPDWIWVGAPIPANPLSSCKKNHKIVWPVIVEDLPDDIKPKAEKCLEDHGSYSIPVVCICQGRIIE